jgi:hypothetical protein
MVRMRCFLFFVGRSIHGDGRQTRNGQFNSGIRFLFNATNKRLIKEGVGGGGREGSRGRGGGGEREGGGEGWQGQGFILLSFFNYLRDNKKKRPPPHKASGLGFDTALYPHKYENIAGYFR